MAHCGVFLDRDGTINYEVNYLTDVAQLAVIDGAADGVKRLNSAGVKVVVITNQAAIARGYMTESNLQSIHDALRAQLKNHGASIDAIYYCPHHPTEGQNSYRRDCECRKPNSGMLRQAAEDCDIDLTKSFVVGDKISDLQAGARVGCATVLVRTGYGAEAEKSLASTSIQPDFIAADLSAASQWILNRLQAM